MKWVRRGVLLVVVGLGVLFLWQRTQPFDHGNEASETVSVFGPWLGSDADGLAAVLTDFEEATGLEVHYIGSANFTSELRERVAGRVDIPDIAIVPQAGFAAELIAQGAILPMPPEVVDTIEDHSSTELENLGYGGEVYLAPYRASIKSLVWYRPSEFERRGWEIPQTLDQLSALADQVERDGVAPWCFSVFSGTSTGWPATDWVEDLMLRRSGPDAYDRWVAGDLLFDSEEVRAAIEEFDDLLVAPGRSAGGPRSILKTSISETNRPLFEDPAECAMYKQATFATSWFPSDVEYGPDGDVDFFVLPGLDADESAPLVRGITLLTRFDDRPEVGQLLEFMTSPAGASAWIELGGFLSPYDDVEPDVYDGVERQFAELLAEERVERSDASDFMLSDPRQLYYREISSYIAGAHSVDQLVEDVDTARQDAAGSFLDQLGNSAAQPAASADD